MRDFHGEDVVGVHPRVHHGKPLHRACEQAGAGEENDGHRDLRDDEPLLQPLPPGTARGALAAGRQRCAELVLTRKLGRKREQHGDDHGERQGEGEHRAVNADLAGAWAVPLGEGDQHPHTTKSQHKTERGPEERQHQVFGEQELAEARGAGAQRGAHREFVFAAHAAHERQVGDVRAGDDEDKGRGAHQEPEGELGLLPEDFLEWRECDRVARRRIVGLGMVGVHPLGDGGDFGARLLDRRTGGEAGDHLRHAMRATGDHHRAHVVLAVHHVHDGVDAGREVRGRLQHAHDLDGLAADPHRLADDRAVAAKAFLPVLVREHHHGGGAGAIVTRAKGAAEHGGQAHDREVIPGDEADVDAHRVLFAQQAHRDRRVFGDAGERL